MRHPPTVALSAHASRTAGARLVMHGLTHRMTGRAWTPGRVLSRASLRARAGRASQLRRRRSVPPARRGDGRSCAAPDSKRRRAPSSRRPGCSRPPRARSSPSAGSTSTRSSDGIVHGGRSLRAPGHRVGLAEPGRGGRHRTLRRSAERQDRRRHARSRFTPPTCGGRAQRRAIRRAVARLLSRMRPESYTTYLGRDASRPRRHRRLADEPVGSHHGLPSAHLISPRGLHARGSAYA